MICERDIALRQHIGNALQIIANSFAEADEMERLRLCKLAAERIVLALDNWLPLPTEPGRAHQQFETVHGERPSD